MRAACTFVLASALLLAGACSKLPDIPADVCGNGVLEPGEDCDSFTRNDLTCRSPGMVGQCHMDCSPGEDGARTVCPDGWGCDPDDVCRKATGEYQVMSERILGNAWSLGSGDFDGDGRAEVLASERPSALGSAKSRVHYFDRDAVPSGTFNANHFLATPSTIPVRGSSRTDLAFAGGGGLGLLRGELDGSLISEALPSYFVPDTETRLINVLSQRIGNSASLLVVARFAGEAGLFRQALTSARIELAARLPGGVEELAAEPLAADLRDDPARFPCLDVVLAFRAASELLVYAPCELAPDSGQPDWRSEPDITALALEPESRISGGLIAADLDGDGHLDLLVGSEAGPYAAYGDGERFGPLQPYPIVLNGDSDQEPGVPIAGGDLNGDRVADLVVPHGVLLADASAGPRAVRYTPAMPQIGAPWTEAVIADFNRDGHADVFAGSSQGLDLDFFAGTSSRALNYSTIPTNRPVEQLAFGDFDADLVNDLAFVQRDSSPGGGAEVSIAFGDLQGAPETPRAVARQQSVQQVAVFSNGDETTISNLSLVYDQNDDDGVRGSAIALLSGDPDRNMPCLLELSTFQENGELATGNGLAISVGAFIEPKRSDVIALSSGDIRNRRDYALWALPDIGSRRGTTTRLGWGFAPDLEPLLKSDTDIPNLAASLAAGDLNGDGIDELVLAGPDGTGTRCLIASADVEPESEQPLHVYPTVVLEAACKEPAQLSVVDLDDDGQRDVLVLIGSEGERRLWALWGDGSQQLGASRLDDLTPQSGEPRAFAAFRATVGAPLALAYVTSDAVRMLRAGKRARSFEDDGPLASLEQGTGIVAADVDGDGVTDLAIADSGAVRVLRAKLEAP